MEDRVIVISAKEYAPIIAAATGYFLEHLTDRINNDDLPEAEMFELMDISITAGTLWVKSLRAQGIPQEEIVAALSSVGMEADPRDG